MAKINLRKSGLPPSVFIGIITLVFFGLGGYLLITYGQGRSFLTIFAEGKSLLHQLSSGAIVGVLSAGLALMIVTRKFFTQQKHYYFRLISQWRLTYAEMIFLSLCAGIAEEVFFRSGLQPLLGIWLTSVLFVLLHGYLSINNWRISIYGIVMVGVIGGFGYLYEYSGIYSVMMAHALFDLILFLYIDRKMKTSTTQL